MRAETNFFIAAFSRAFSDGTRISGGCKVISKQLPQKFLCGTVNGLFGKDTVGGNFDFKSEYDETGESRPRCAVRICIQHYAAPLTDGLCGTEFYYL